MDTFDLIKDMRGYIIGKICKANNAISVFNEMKSELDSLPRDIRRQYKKEYDMKMKNASVVKKSIIELERLLDVINDSDKCLVCDDDYILLLSYIYNTIETVVCDGDMISILLGNDDRSIELRKELCDYANQILKYFVLDSKKKNINIKFVNLFDDKGDLLVDSYYKFDNYLDISRKKYLIFNNNDYIRKLFYSDDYLMRVDNYNTEKQLLKEKEKIEKRSKRLEGKKNSTITTDNVVLKKNVYVRNEYDKYLDSSLELRSDVLDNISLSDLLNVLKTIPDITKKKLEYYEDAYNRMFIKHETDKLLLSLDEKDLKKIKLLLSSEKGKYIYDIIEDEVLSNDYSSMSENEVKSLIIDKINSLFSDDKEIINNFIIFPTDSFYSDEISNITSNSSNYDMVNSSLLTQINYLKTQDMHKISSLKGAFHEIIDTKTHNPLVVDDNLKAYRYGSRKSKVCLFRLSVSPYNRQMLKEKYNSFFNPHVLLVFSLGNVLIENEKDFYIRANKNASVYLDEIRYISNLFKNDFTAETFDIACGYIDSCLSLDKKCSL